MEKFFGKNLKGGTKVKFTPSPLLEFLRNLRENLKGGPKKIFWTKFRNVSFGPPLRFQ
jgi:hypothetical protein